VAQSVVATISSRSEFQPRREYMVKNFLLRRNKFASCVSVATTIVGIFISMTMPARAEITNSHCEEEGGDGDQSEEMVIVQAHDERKCFQGEGEQGVLIHNVSALYARENNGYVTTNKGTFQFWENEQVNFNVQAGGTVVITGISLDESDPDSN
jgi:hypothetical protein